MTHDAAGNLLTQEIDVDGQTVTITYTWDAWNRLVGVAYDSQDRSEYRYSALNWPFKHATRASPPYAPLRATG